MLLNEYHRAEVLAQEKNDAQLAEMLKKAGRIREVASWISIVSLLTATLGRYLLARAFSGYSSSGVDTPVVLAAALGFAITMVVSDRGRRKTDRIELALMLRKKSAENESKQG